MFPLFTTVDTVTSADYAAIISALTAQLSITTIVEVVAALVTACVGLWFLWWGARKTFAAIKSAFQGRGFGF